MRFSTAILKGARVPMTLSSLVFRPTKGWNWGSKWRKGHLESCCMRLL